MYMVMNHRYFKVMESCFIAELPLASEEDPLLGFRKHVASYKVESKYCVSLSFTV